MQTPKQCCSCLRILVAGGRDDRGVWLECSRALPVTHGLCPACAQRYRESAAALAPPVAKVA